MTTTTKLQRIVDRLAKVEDRLYQNAIEVQCGNLSPGELKAFEVWLTAVNELRIAINQLARTTEPPQPVRLSNNRKALKSLDPDLIECTLDEFN